MLPNGRAPLNVSVAIDIVATPEVVTIKIRADAVRVRWLLNILFTLAPVPSATAFLVGVQIFVYEVETRYDAAWRSDTRRRRRSSVRETVYGARWESRVFFRANGPAIVSDVKRKTEEYEERGGGETSARERDGVEKAWSNDVTRSWLRREFAAETAVTIIARAN